MTHQLVRKIELGAHAITLDQIQFFAREMGLEAWELMHPNGRTPQRPAKPTRAHS
jgi:hypothetical protein